MNKCCNPVTCWQKGLVSPVLYLYCSLELWVIAFSFLLVTLQLENDSIHNEHWCRYIYLSVFMCLRWWSVILTQICHAVLSDLYLHFFIWYHHWLRHLCKEQLSFEIYGLNWFLFLVTLSYFLSLFNIQIHIYGLWYNHGATQLVACWIYLLFNCIHDTWLFLFVAP